MPSASRTLCLLLILLGVLVAACPSRAASSLRLSIYPRVSLTEGVRITAYISRDPDNRRMRLEVDGPFSRAFEEQMEGDAARVVYPMFIDHLPEGEYTVFLTVLWVDRTKADGWSTLVKKDTFCRGSGCIGDVPQ